jgi:uncharacterized protein YqgC (DUF456 family)
MHYLAATLVTLGALIGVALTLFTLPGIWFAILIASLAQWWHHAHYNEWMFSWWTLGVCVGLGLVAEAVELFASAAGAAKAGGSKRGAVGSIIGGLVGAIAGSFVVPILGTIIGAAAGAGLGALLLEQASGKKTWTQSTRIGAGAAAGRLVATILKAGFAGLIALILSIAAFF